MRHPEFLAHQGRRPDGWLGQLVARLMAWETRQQNDKALDLLEVRPGHRVLEIGFGHGRSIARIAMKTRGGLVAGVDSSPSMVSMAKRHNRSLVDRGLIDLRLGDGLSLPFADGFLDRAFSVHTLYFFDYPVAQFREARRILNDNGRFVLGFRPASEKVLRSFPASVYTFYTTDQVDQMLRAASFRKVDLVETGDMAFAVASASDV